MRIACVDIDGAPVRGVLTDSGLVPLDRLGVTDLAGLASLSAADRASRLDQALRGGAPPAAAGPFRVPWERPPRNMFCIGTNYRAHFDEGDRPADTTLPTEPVVFTKPWTTLVGDRDDIRVDEGTSEKVDWEVEVAVVIGTGGRHIAEERALDHVLGYALANDVSARDVQLRKGNLNQWFLGKGLDTFCPAGPWITTADAVDITDVHIELAVNGVRKQHGHTRDLIFDVPFLISYLSRYTALLPGDVILTGTPSGVGQWQTPQEFLGDGDVVTLTSPELGTLQNTVVRVPAGAAR